jgi:two-component system alkaline phosphatase synthesis response regulator PhoP
LRYHKILEGEAETERHTSRASTPGGEAMANKKTILVIDDEPDTVVYFTSLLEDNGYVTVTAENGEQGLLKVGESPPDLITLDISMPETSGVRFYRELRDKEEWKSIPVIMITGVSEDFKSFISSRKQVPPPDGYLAKPVKEEDLLSLVKKLLPA